MTNIKTMSSLTKHELEEKYLGKEVHVIINDPFHPLDAYGTVTHVDDMKQIHGTWGGLAVIPGVDYICLKELD